ncbi:MAG TPA: hypothetical protein VG122_23795 [Gemmata sp.]|nr:hypothetical protein [Gemmata sp.]
MDRQMRVGLRWSHTSPHLSTHFDAMTHLIVLVTLIPCLTILAEDPKAPVTALEGTWHELGMPGEDSTVRHKIVFVGDKVTITIGTQILTGTFIADSQSKGNKRHSIISCKLKNPQGKEMIVSGIYRIEKEELSLRLDPEVTLPLKPSPKVADDLPPEARLRQLEILSSTYLHRAPLTLTLGKVKN